MRKYHHDKHHQAYVTKRKQSAEGARTDFEASTLEEHRQGVVGEECAAINQWAALQHLHSGIG